MSSVAGESLNVKEEPGATTAPETADLIADDDLSHVLKEKKKKKHHGEKRKRSCSTDSTNSSTSSHKRHKKKKKKKNRDDPPSPKVNPIFLWVKQDHTKIVEVRCEDYDKRNRIKLTKTAGGWVAIPRTNMFCPETPKESKEEPVKDKDVNFTKVKEEVMEVKKEINMEVTEEVEDIKGDAEVEKDERLTCNREETPPPTLEPQTSPPPIVERERSPPPLDIKEPPILPLEPEKDDSLCDIPPIVESDLPDASAVEKPELDEASSPEKKPENDEPSPEISNSLENINEPSTVEEINIGGMGEALILDTSEPCETSSCEVSQIKDAETSVEPECTETKCCPVVNVDENHNNEVDPVASVPEDKNLEDEFSEEATQESMPHVSLEEPIEILNESIEDSQKAHEENCENLMNDLADLCFIENMKEEVDGKELKDLGDIYTFVPSPVEEKEEVKSFASPDEEKELVETKKPPSPEACPINLVVHPERDKPIALEKNLKLEPLKQSDLDSLDILWRLPEGTTISQSKPLDGKPPIVLPPAPTFSQPVQEEPLNLGKPKPKEEKKPTPKPASEDSKLMELLKSDHRLQSNPLDQLKEVLSDPDLCVPDPLLVPRARLSALIANPKKEIPKLLAQTKEINYPKLMDPDLMVVSLAHLQSILQKSGKEADLNLYQQQMLSTYEKMDPTTAAINQMLWLPYLSQLEAKHNQELMAMLYPHYMYPQAYVPAVTGTTRYPIYQRSTSWPRAETSKPKPQPPKHNHHESKHREHPQSHQPKQEAKPKLKVRDNLIEPKLKVRDNLVEPNQRTNLLKFDPTSPFLPSVGVPPNANLWHPLFSRNARLDMRRFTPKPVRTGGSTRAIGIGRRQ